MNLLYFSSKILLLNISIRFSVAVKIKSDFSKGMKNLELKLYNNFINSKFNKL